MRTLILDCRWLGHAGVGRVTELLLRGLCEGDREARWILWGPDASARLAPEFELISDDTDPRRWLGQHGLLRVPRRDAPIVFMHQTRPLISPQCVTVIHDTTQLRTPASAPAVWARRAFLRRSAGASHGVITVSEWSKRRIAEDLKIPSERIRVVGNPVDPVFAERIRRLREANEQSDFALFVGSFAPHKNLPRLIAAFRRTDFSRSGGRLVLVGGRPDELADLRARITTDQISALGRCPQDQLDGLYAEALFVVQPSLEEGFGLPVWEAMAAGVPVCSSTGGALSTTGAGSVASFDPLSVSAMAAAIDATARAARERGRGQEVEASRAFLATHPTPADYARGIESATLALIGEPLRNGE